MSASAALHLDAACRRTLDHLSALVRIWTPTDGVVYVNSAWCELTGSSPEENVADGWLRYVHDEDREGLLSALHARSFAHAEYRLAAAEGPTAVTDSAAIWRSDDDGGALALVHTITPKRESPADADRHKSMSKWAHELRGPLNAILGWSDLLSAGDATADVMQRGLKAIASNARQQAQIIKRMAE